MTKLYLKQTTTVEPLFNNWFSWPVFIPPHSAALYLKNHYLPMVASFLEEPELHAAAIENPAMRAGPFINGHCGYKRLELFFEDSKNNLAPLLNLASMIEQLEQLMKAQNGYTLINLYKQLPSALRGMVELVYDLNHSPSIRFIERLLYKSEFYNPDLQSIRLGSIESDVQRFSLNTPKLDPGILNLRVPHSDRLIDALSVSRYKGLDQEQLIAALPWDRLSDTEKKHIFTCFTEQLPSNIRHSNPREFSIKYFGHATLLIQAQGMSIMTDPCVSPYVEGAKRRYDYSDLPEVIDVVLITHAHQDHVIFETLLQLRHKIKKIIVPRSSGGFLQDPSLKLMLEILGFDNVSELGELEHFEYGPARITGIPFFGEHGDLHIQTKIGYCVNINQFCGLFLADSDVLDPEMYDATLREIGSIDAVFIGMDSVGAPYRWLYGALYNTPLDHARGKDRRINGSNADKAFEFVKRISPKAAYVYAMGAEPWISHITGSNTDPNAAQNREARQFVEKCTAQGIESKVLYWMDQL
ncbi:MBL fold metallo-hydrolase [Pseudomonas sp. MYb193]|uniref:MBL fold metallo-hydrolase n=1 Tax=Pseudomonas sp. MYb193 TaxID=1827300 RepID=UPI000CF5E395|nr:MBL fold metallo-hydrolase [Pseudomonas sp. MYb193]AVJ24099.1 polyketide synthase [Pseudomonas sp. MYb193]